MRKITRDSIEAFLNFEEFYRDNTQVKVDGKGLASLYLYGNLIATHNPENSEIRISNAGWFTNVTKERLNGIPKVNLTQRNFKWYLNDKEWYGDWITV